MNITKLLKVQEILDGDPALKSKISAVKVKVLRKTGEPLEVSEDVINIMRKYEETSIGNIKKFDLILTAARYLKIIPEAGAITTPAPTSVPEVQVADFKPPVEVPKPDEIPKKAVVKEELDEDTKEDVVNQMETQAKSHGLDLHWAVGVYTQLLCAIQIATMDKSSGADKRRAALIKVADDYLACIPKC